MTHIIELARNPWVKFTGRFTAISVLAAMLGLLISKIVSAIVGIFSVELAGELDYPTLYSLGFVIAYLGYILLRELRELHEIRTKQLTKLINHIENLETQITDQKDQILK